MTANRRLGVCTLCGVVTSAGCLALGAWDGAVLLGWIVAGSLFIGWTWLLVGRLDGEGARSHATEEDPLARWAHILLLVAVAASVVGVGFVLAGASGVGAGGAGTGGTRQAALGVVAILVSWVLVHTLYTVRYAHVFYGQGGTGVDFAGTDLPDYLDFAYLAFTLGMTYQVSDTNLTTPRMRRIVLGHSLLSYLLGVVVIAMALNLVVQVAGSLA